MSTSEMTIDQLNRALRAGHAGIEQANDWVNRWNGCGLYLSRAAIIESDVSLPGVSLPMVAPKVILSNR